MVTLMHKQASMRWSRAWFALALISGATPSVAGLSTAWDWALSYETAKPRESAFVEAQTSHSAAVNGMLDLQLDYACEYGVWTSLWTLYSQDLYLDDGHQSAWWQERDSDLIVRELAWQGEWTIYGLPLDVSVGKLRLDWGVGYGYRPLDLFRPYRQNPISLVAEEGTGVVSLSHFDLDGEWTWLATDSSWTHATQTALDKASEQRGSGIRRYWLNEQSEYQWIGYYDDVRRGLLAASLRSVWSDSLAWHVSTVWQRQSVGYQFPTTTYTAPYVAEQGHALQALVGLNWASQDGHNLIGEYWYDSRSWSHDEWQQALERAESLKMAAQTAGLAASYQQGFQHANLVQHNLMLHWSWDLQAWLMWNDLAGPTWLSDITPTLDLLFSPQDGGVIATQWLRYQWIDTGAQSVEVEFAARFLTGNGDSVYAHLPDQHMMVFNLKGRF
nr:hypothetical protein [Vibrio navarrensis]